jgi:hypothetical protein
MPLNHGYSRGFMKSPVARECVVADTVRIEPVSTANSLLTGKRTGNFAEFGHPLRFLRPIAERIQ